MISNKSLDFMGREVIDPSRSGQEKYKYTFV